jgi:hypothetical protein
MGRSLDTKLVYGYKLGGQEDDWELLGLPYDEENYTYTWPSWVKLNEDGDPEDTEDEGFIDQAQKRLNEVFVRSVGFHASKPDWETEHAAWQDWVHARNAAKKKAGIGSDEGLLDLVYGGITNWQDHYLGIRIADGQQDFTLDPQELADRLYAHHARWDEILHRAVNILEIRPPHIPQLWVIADYS